MASLLDALETKLKDDGVQIDHNDGDEVNFIYLYLLYIFL